MDIYLPGSTLSIRRVAMFDVKWYSILNALLVFRTGVNDYSKFKELFNVSVYTASMFKSDPRQAWIYNLCNHYKIGVLEWNYLYVYSALYRRYFNVGNHYDLDILRRYL